MSSMSPLRDIINGDPVDATDPQYNFQTIENFIDSDVVTTDGAKGFTDAVSGVAGTDPAHLATLSQVSATVPVGTVVMFAGTSIPSEWAWCRGAAVSQTDPDYVDLFAVIGVTFGDPGSGNFNLPDFRDRSPVGSGTTYALAETFGRSDWELLTHSHVMNHGHSNTLGTGNDSHSHSVTGSTDNDSHSHDTNLHNNTTDASSGANANASNSSFGPQVDTDTDTHSHSVTGTAASETHNHSITGSVTNFSGSTSSSGTESTTAGQNYQPSLGINFIIKL